MGSHTVDRVNLWVCVHVPNTLNINYEHILTRHFIRKVRERLWGIALVVGLHISVIVVVLAVLAFNMAFHTKEDGWLVGVDRVQLEHKGIQELNL